MAILNFDPSSIDDDKGPAPVPAGRYLLEIIDTKSIENKKGTGEYLFIILRVVEGTYEGKKIFDRINYINSSEQAQQIARKQLKRLCWLCGVQGELTDSEQLHFKRFYANVIIRPDEGWGAQNEVRYPAVPAEGQAELPMQEPPWPTANGNGQAAAKPAPSAKPAPARPAPASTARPWEKRPKF